MTRKSHKMKYCRSIIVFLLALILTSGINKPRLANVDKQLIVGDTAPAFTLIDQDGKVFNSTDYVGKKIMIIYFYPKDESMVCTKEACSFRDSFDEFAKNGAMVIGINGGSVASHKSFRDHYKLPFTLLSDPNDKVYHLFGVSNVLFMTGRKTFVIDLKGKIAFIYEGIMQGKQHVDGALNFIKKNQSK